MNPPESCLSPTPPPGVPVLSPLEAARPTRGGSVSAPHPDGFGGVRDARILADSRSDGPGARWVQCTARSRDLLRRAGYSRPAQHEFYSVRVVLGDFKRLQLA